MVKIMIHILSLLGGEHWTAKRQKLHDAIDDVNTKAKEIAAMVKERTERNIAEDIYNVTHKKL